MSKNKFNLRKFFFGHEKIHKADMAEIIVMIVLVLYLAFMILKLKEFI